MTDPWPASSYLVNDKLRFVYCPIPKVASSSLKQWFLTTLGFEPGRSDWPERPHEYLFEWLRGRSKAIPDSYLSFAFVRDPRRRLVSAFLQKFVVRWDVSESPARPVIREICDTLHRPVDYAQGVSFRSFVKYIVSRAPMELDVHWRPQHLFLASPKAIDFVGQVESFDADMLLLTRRLGIKYSQSFRALQLPYSSAMMEGAPDMTAGQLRRLNAFPVWRSFYDDELLAVVSDYYSADDRRFGYVANGCHTAHTAAVLSC